MPFYKEKILNDIILPAGQAAIVEFVVVDDATIARIFCGPTELEHVVDYTLSIYSKEEAAEAPNNLIIDTEDRSISGSGNAGFIHPKAFEVIEPITSTAGIAKYRAENGPKSGYPVFSHDLLEGSDPSAKSRSRSLYVRIVNNGADTTTLSLLIGYWYGE